jgi:hypothetical protein
MAAPARVDDSVAEEAACAVPPEPPEPPELPEEEEEEEEEEAEAVPAANIMAENSRKIPWKVPSQITASPPPEPFFCSFVFVSPSFLPFCTPAPPARALLLPPRDLGA